MVKKSLSRFYSYPYFTGALMIRLGRDVLKLSGGLSGFCFMGVSSLGFGGLTVTLVSGISTGTDAPSSLLSEEAFAVGGVGAYPGIGLIWTRRLPWCMIVVRPLKRLSHLTIGPSFPEVSS